MRYEGYTGTILIDGTDLVWIRRPIPAKVNRLPAQQRVALSDVTGAVLTPATRMVNGRLTVLLRGESPPKLTVGTAPAHPGTVLFRHRDNDTFSRLHQWLLQVAAVNTSSPSGAATDPSTDGVSLAGPAAEPLVDPPILAKADVFPRNPAVGLVWVAPEGWPPVPTGWWPDAGWMPSASTDSRGADFDEGRDRLSHQDLPADHQFWRVVSPPEAVAAAARERPGLPEEYQETGFPTNSELRRWEVSTFPGRIEMLNDLESVLTRAHEWRSAWTVDDAAYSSLGVRLRTDDPRKAARLEAWTSLVTMVVAARDWLLQAIARDIEPATEYFAWIDQFPGRSDRYWAADRAVDEALEQARDRVLATMTPQQRHRYWFGDGPAPGSAEEWQAAELLAERVLRQIGFEDVSRTPAGADKGLDVASDVLAAQVKYTSTPVGRPVLQQLQGAAAGRITVFFSRAGYSSAALEYANEVGMALFHMTLPVQVRAVNDAAERMVREAG